MDETKKVVVVKTRSDFDEMNALSIEDICILHDEFDYDFIIENGRIVGFTLNEI